MNQQIVISPLKRQQHKTSTSCQQTQEIYHQEYRFDRQECTHHKNKSQSNDNFSKNMDEHGNSANMQEGFQDASSQRNR